MQEPLKYTLDCIRLVGHIVHHTSWPSVDEHKMKKSCEDTINNWKKEFESDISTDHLYNTARDSYDYWND